MQTHCALWPRKQLLRCYPLQLLWCHRHVGAEASVEDTVSESDTLHYRLGESEFKDTEILAYLLNPIKWPSESQLLKRKPARRYRGRGRRGGYYWARGSLVHTPGQDTHRPCCWFLHMNFIEKEPARLLLRWVRFYYSWKFVMLYVLISFGSYKWTFQAWSLRTEYLWNFCHCGKWLMQRKRLGSSATS